MPTSGAKRSRGKEQSNDTVGMRLNEAYSWLLVPTQEGTDPIVWEATRISGSDDNRQLRRPLRKSETTQQLNRANGRLSC